jgi:hypothetical protein
MLRNRRFKNEDLTLTILDVVSLNQKSLILNQKSTIKNINSLTKEKHL